jgi:hypothetical protein
MSATAKILSDICNIVSKHVSVNFCKKYPDIDENSVREIIKNLKVFSGNGPSKSPGKTPIKNTPKKSLVKGNEKLIIIDRNPEAKSWIIKGTTFAIKSAKDTTVIGKIRMNKIVPLSNIEKKACSEKGWTCQ